MEGGGGGFQIGGHENIRPQNLFVFAIKGAHILGVFFRGVCLNVLLTVKCNIPCFEMNLFF